MVIAGISAVDKLHEPGIQMLHSVSHVWKISGLDIF